MNNTNNALSMRLRCFLVAAMLGFAGPSAAALTIEGDTQGAPGDLIEIRLALDAPLVALVDDLSFALTFDPAVLSGIGASAGSVIAAGFPTLEPSTGLGTASFFSLSTELPAGELATWTFQIAPNAVLGTQQIQASLRTFTIDSNQTAELFSAPFSVQVVPEPSTYAFMLAGIATILLLHFTRRRRAAA